MSAEEQRALLRVEVAKAARVIAPVWPIERFVAVNPLHGLVELGFEAAVDEARRWLRASGYPDGPELQRALGEGRVEDGDLRSAVLAHLPILCSSASMPVDGRDVTVLDLLVTDLATAAHQVEPGAPEPRSAAERFDATHGTTLAPAVDLEVSRWLALLAQPDHGSLAVPGRAAGAYQAWRELVVHDRRVRRLVGRRGIAELRAAPVRPDDAVDDALTRLGLAAVDRPSELRGQLARLPGWAGYARWCDEWAPPGDPARRLSLLDVLAIRLVVESLAIEHGAATSPALGKVEPIAPPAGLDHDRDRAAAALAALGVHPPSIETMTWAAGVLSAVTDSKRGQLILSALESAHRRRLITAIEAVRPSAPADPAAQVVLCIDGRSEGLRRHLEAVGPYATLGFAGFFAAAMVHRPLGAAESYPSAPVLVDAEVEIRELPAPGAEQAARSWVRRRRTGAAAAGTLDEVAHGPASMYALAEAAGWALGPLAMARTLRPRIARRDGGPATTVGVDDALGTGFTLEERTLVAETALRTMGLTSGFAPVVLLCGHGASTAANPHAASLDCGACGGNPGGPNARAAAAICNDPAVRAELAARGIAIPESTWFVAGEHDTTTDAVEIYDWQLIPASHRGAVEQLAADLELAGEGNAAARVARLPGTATARSAAREVRARAGDWAQTQPEWGLVRNAAFIVGPRDLTRGLDLEGRAFLHSYDDLADADGTALETILTAPMVVAHWINAQYYFSTVDPQLYGAGDKTLHNPVSGLGVLSGAGGDLRIGLPWQSVMRGDLPEHEPIRLLTLVQAPLERIDAVIARNPILRHLFDGGWVRMSARERGATEWQHRQADGSWRHDALRTMGTATKVLA